MEGDDIQELVVRHLRQLTNEFNRYLAELDAVKQHTWIRAPFEVKMTDLPEEMTKLAGFEEQLTEIQADETLRLSMREKRLDQFWIALNKEKTVCANQAIRILTHFATTWVCEHGFSALTALKTKYRNKLKPEHDMRCTLTKKEPSFEKLVRRIQSHPSH